MDQSQHSGTVVDGAVPRTDCARFHSQKRVVAQVEIIEVSRGVAVDITAVQGALGSMHR